MFADLRFLVVDDDISSIEGLSHLLGRLGAIKVSMARSGHEAFEILAKSRQRFDCLISDVFMADGNGLELLHQIRTTSVARSFRPDMSIVLMSGMASATIADTARRLDANAFIVKPFTMHKLQATIAASRRRAFPLNRDRYIQIDTKELQVA